MANKPFGTRSPVRADRDVREDDAGEERSEIRRRSDVRTAVKRRRRSYPTRPPSAHPRAERRSHRSLELLPPLEPAAPKRDSSCERIGRRLPLLALSFAAIAGYAIASGSHPMAPGSVVAIASASSAALVAMMARQRMIAASHAVAFAAVTASTHAWAQACVAPGGATGASFAITALASVVLFDRPSHVLGYLGTVAVGFTVALGASAIPDPLTAWLALAAASLVAIAVTAARRTLSG